MEKHYVFKSLFEDNINQVSSIGAELGGLRRITCATRRTFSGVLTVRGWPGGFLLTMDAVVLNCLTKCNVVWCVGTFLFLPMSKCRRKTRRVRVAELKKTFPQQTLDALPTNAAWWLKASNRSTQRCVFHRATYKDVGKALNLNRPIFSIPPCICLFQFSTCFEQPSAHHHQSQM